MMKFFKTLFNDFLGHRFFYLCLLLVVLLMTFTLQANQKGADELDYLRWTHSFVFDQDLHLLNNFQAIGGSYNLTPTGYIFARVNIGAPLLWLPFYGVAALFLPTLTDSPYPGEEAIQILWINFSSWLFIILAGILTVMALRPWFSRSVLLITILVILLGTPTLFYMLTFSTSAHPAAIFLAALLLYLWLADPDPKNWGRYWLVGLVIGWLMLMANYNVVFWLLPAAGLLKDFVAQKNWRQLLLNGLATGGGGLLGFLPQMITWWFLFGSPFYSPYSSQLFWLEPYILETLFSTFHGLFFFAPVLLGVIPGWWWLRRRDGWLALSLGLIGVGLTYIVSSSVSWWAGSSFGNRYFLTLTPFFALGLASFFQQTKKWGFILGGPGVLWTIGLYLQFLQGVRLTSDSVVYSPTEIVMGQLPAWANIFHSLPLLVADRPWFAVSPLVLPLMIVILVGSCRLLYGWGTTPDSQVAVKIQAVMSLAAIGLMAFITLAGWRGEQTKAALARQGFYNQPHEVVLRETKEVAGKSGLVARAMFHEQTNQPDKAIADLQLASAMWKPDKAAVSERLYLGPGKNLAETPPRNLLSSLDYPGDVRLIGYQLTQADKYRLEGELFWEKRPGEKSRDKATPVIRAFDSSGQLLGKVTLNSPFPAYYIPAGGLFQDRFSLPFDSPPHDWVWLGVSLAEEPSQLPLNGQGQAESGLIASVNIANFPPKPSGSGESLPEVSLPLGRRYQPGQTVPVQIQPLNFNDPNPVTQLQLSLLDSTGKAIAQQKYPIDNLSGVIPAKVEILSSTLYPPTLTCCFPLPAVAPPGDYRLEVAFQPAAPIGPPDSRPIQLSSTGSTTTICNLLAANFSRRYEPVAPQFPLDISLTDEVKLAGYDLSIIPQAGSISARLVLAWHAQANVSQNYRVLTQLLDPAGQPVVTQAGIPGHGLRPTSTWLKGEWILDEHILNVPPLAPGNYQLSLTLLTEPTGEPVNHSEPGLILQDVPIR